MARLSVDYFSAALMRTTTTLDVILPVDNPGEAMGVDHTRRQDPSAWDRRDYPSPKPPFKTLYLLHGITGNHTDLISETRIRAWAEERQIAVVMPSGYNAFYLDHPETHNYYGHFVGEELLDVTRRMFPALQPPRGHVYRRRLDGCLRRAPQRPQVLRELWIDHARSRAPWSSTGFEQIISDGLFFLSRPFLESTFGDLDKVVDSDKDPRRASPPILSTATARARESLWRAAPTTR